MAAHHPRQPAWGSSWLQACLSGCKIRTPGGVGGRRGQPYPPTQCPRSLGGADCAGRTGFDAGPAVDTFFTDLRLGVDHRNGVGGAGGNAGFAAFAFVDINDVRHVRSPRSAFELWITRSRNEEGSCMARYSGAPCTRSLPSHACQKPKANPGQTTRSAAASTATVCSG